MRAHLVPAAIGVVLTACGGPTVIEDVAYDPRHGQATTLDLHSPDATCTTPRPAVVLIHGGAWRAGSKQAFTDLGEQLAASGYVAATINYRMVPAASYPATFQDCFCALAWLRQHAAEHCVDPDRVAALGYSAGGHLAALLGTAADLAELQADCPSGPTGPPAAVISGAGPQDLRALGGDVVVDLLGGGPDEVPERYDLASPRSHVRAGLPPFLFIHAEADWFVELAQSREMRDALRAAGNQAELLALPGGGHLLNEGPDLGHEYGAMTTEMPEAQLAIGGFLADAVGTP